MADDESIADIALVAVEHQPQVDEADVVLAQAHPGIGRLAESLCGIRADADQRPVPRALHAVFGEYRVRRGRGRVLVHARAHAAADGLQDGPAALAGPLHQCRVVTRADGLARMIDRLQTVPP